MTTSATSWTLTVSVLLVGCYVEQSGEEPPEPQQYQITIDDGPLHIGHETHEGWPAPLGDCVTRTFDITQLPEGGGYLAFYHAGGSTKGSIAINGTLVFSKMTWVDQLVDQLADAIACSVAEAIAQELGGTAGSCGGGSVRSITRSLDPGLLVPGPNTAEICRTSGDLVVARLAIRD